jgi:hypothetical protein
MYCGGDGGVIDDVTSIANQYPISNTPPAYGRLHSLIVALSHLSWFLERGRNDMQQNPYNPFMNHHYQVSGPLRSASPLPVLTFFTMAATPTLPPDWTPTLAGCLEPSDFWIWDYHTDPGDNRTVLGGPSQTSDCFPPSWASTGVYSGTQCPTLYTAACQADDLPGEVTCCPTSDP